MPRWSPRGAFRLENAQNFGQGLGTMLAAYLGQKRYNEVTGELMTPRPVPQYGQFGSAAPERYNMEAQPFRSENMPALMWMAQNAPDQLRMMMEMQPQDRILQGPDGMVSAVRSRMGQVEGIRALQGPVADVPQRATPPPRPSNPFDMGGGRQASWVYDPVKGWTTQDMGPRDAKPDKEPTPDQGPKIQQIRTRIADLTKRNFELGQKMREIDAGMVKDADQHAILADSFAAAQLKQGLQAEITANEEALGRLNGEIGGSWRPGKPKETVNYDGLSEDELFARAWTGDKAAYDVAKKRGYIK